MTEPAFTANLRPSPIPAAWAAWMLLLALLLIGLPAGAQDVGGKWNVTFKGNVHAVLTLQQNGRSVSGSLTTADRTSGLVTGEMVGNELRLARDTGVQTIQRYLVVVQGNSFSGRFWNEGKYADEGSFEGRREQATAPPPPAAPVASVAGEWTITFNGTLRLTMTLQQSGDSVSGSMKTSDGTAGQLRGTLVGNELTLSRDTGVQTIQYYRARVSGDRFEGTFWNEGRHPDKGSIAGQRTSGGPSTVGGVGGTPAPVAPTSQPINLNGGWQGNLLHIFQEGDQILITASWKQPSGAWVIWRAEGRVTSRRFSLPIRYSSMTAARGSTYQGDFVLSDDGDTLSAQYLQAGQVVDRQVYRRDR